MTTTTELALRRFTRSCLREARFATYCGEKKYAAALRSSISNVLAETRAVRPAPKPLDPEMARRRAIARAWSTVMGVWTGGPPRPR